MDAFIGLGSNLGDRMRNIALALEEVSRLPHTTIRALSRVYETEPAYDPEQATFFNAAAHLDTEMTADVLLAHLLSIEDGMGRVRTRDMGPRVIDLDLLVYENEEWDSPDLTLPHLGIRERAFVIYPLLEIAPHLILPDGTHLRRATATVGRLVRDMGPIVGAEPDGRLPVAHEGWTEVARTEDAQEAVTGFDADLVFKRTVLEEEGIPFAFDPFEPGIDLDPFGFPITIRLLVPESDAARAIALLEAVEQAPVEPVE